MALGLAVDKAAIKKFVNSAQGATLYLKECDSDGSPLTTGDGTIWQAVGITKGTRMEPTVAEEIQTDDRNLTVAKDVTVQDFKITTTLMQRDDASRQMTINAQGSYYQVALAGQKIGTTQEAHAFPICQISPKFTYNIGDAGHIEGVEITTLANDTSVSVTLPTEIGTGTITVLAGKMWGTTDL
jgi:uncharacterized Zn finger protein (UPF0148 family)